MIVIVHGYDGSGDGHWQRWLATELTAAGTAVALPELPEPTAPDKDAWVAALAAIAAAAPSPITYVCHSLGCWAVDHLLATGRAGTVRAALLVAPPSPYLLFEPIQSFLPPPRDRTAWAPLAARTLVVGSDNDEHAGPEEFQEIAGALGAGCRLLPGAGHINTDAGFGPWPFALDWLRAVGAV
jgi:hypothetical protein